MVAGTTDNGRCRRSVDARGTWETERSRSARLQYRGKLTENSAGSVVTGETGLTHTRTGRKSARIHQKDTVLMLWYDSGGGWDVPSSEAAPR
jgi:hypothetical protein